MSFLPSYKICLYNQVPNFQIESFEEQNHIAKYDYRTLSLILLLLSLLLSLLLFQVPNT